MKKNVKKMTVKVTKHHIHNGQPMDGASCPVALALKSMKYTDVNVGGQNDTYVSSRTGKTQYELVVPKLVDDFISKFDSQLPVKPFTFKAERRVIKDEDTNF